MTLSFTAADLKNASLKIGIFHIPPKIIVETLPSGEHKVTGIMAEILEIIANYIGYTYTFKMFDSGMFGREIDENGTWDGIVGSLIDKTIDFEGICLIPESRRFQFIDFTTSILFESYLGVVIRKPTEENISFLTYFKPYPTNVWAVMLLLWLVICFYTTLDDFGFVKKIWKPTLLKVLLIDELSEYKYHLKLSKMISLWAFFVALIVLVSGYNSVLVASVSVKHPAKQFAGIDDILKDGGYRYGINHNYHYYVHICETTEAPYGNLGEIMKNDPDSNILDMDIGFRRTMNEKLAYFVNSVDGKNGIKDMCNLEMIPAKYFSSGFYVSFPKHSPLREIISQYVHRLRTAGILNVILERGISSSRPQCEDATNAVTPISIKHVVLPFQVLGFGMILSVLALLSEKLKSRHRKMTKIH